MIGRGAAVWVGAAMLAACTPAPASRSGSYPVIVSMNPCADAILADIAPDHLAAISHYSHDPAGSSMPQDFASRFPAVSGNAEDVAAFDPDIVVASTFLPPATENALREMGIPVIKTGGIASIDDSIRQIRQLASVAHEQRAGERLVGRIEKAVHEAARSGEPEMAALVWQTGGLVPGEQTLISDLLGHSGFTNWSAGRGLGQGTVLPLEQVLADPPPLMLVAGSGPEEENRKLHHPALGSLSATRRFKLDPTLLFCGGPTIPRALRRLQDIRRESAS